MYFYMGLVVVVVDDFDNKVVDFGYGFCGLWLWLWLWLLQWQWVVVVMVGGYGG